MAGSSASQSTGQSYSDTYIPEYSESPFLRAVAEEARARSDQVYQWGMDQFNKGAKDIDGLMRDALSYASPQRISVDMGMAEAGVQQAGERGRLSAIRDLESYGIDPSAGRYYGLDAAERVKTAAAAAGAGNQQRMADQAAGNAMRNQAIAAGLQNRQFGLGVGDSANRFLATASSLKYPPLGRFSTSQQQSTSASQQTDPAQSSKGGSQQAPKEGGGKGGGQKQPTQQKQPAKGKEAKPPPGKREPPKKPGEEEKPKEELKEPVDPKLQEGPTPESAISGLAEPNEVWTGDPIASGAEPGEVWTGDPTASGAEPGEVWTGDPTVSGAEPNEAWTGPEPFEAGYPPPEGLDEGATPEAAITPDYSQEPPLEAGYPEYDPYAGQTLAGDPFGADYDPTAGIPQAGDEAVASADPAGALYSQEAGGGWGGDYMTAGYEGPTFGGAGEWSDIGQGTMDTGAFDSTYDDFTDYGDQGYGDFGADFGDYGDTGYGDYGDYYPEGGDYGADFGDYGDTGYGDYGDYYPDDQGADYGYESDYYGDESGYDFGDAGDYYDDFTDYGGEGDYGEGADDYYGDESGYDYGGEGDYGEGADDYYGDESGYDYGADADYGYDADYYGDESGYDYGDDSGYYDSGYDDSGGYDSGYDDSGGGGYDDSGGYDSSGDIYGAKGGLVKQGRMQQGKRRARIMPPPGSRPRQMRTGFRQGGPIPGRGRRPPPGARRLAPPPVPPPEARQGGRMPGNFISPNGMQPPATGGMPAPGPQTRMPRAAPQIRPARPRPQHFAGGGQAGQRAEPTQGGFVSRELSPSAGSKVDDVNARLNAGEFVIPKDVATWKGKEFFYKMIAQARKLRAGGDEKPKVGYQTGGTFNPMQGGQPMMNYQTPAQIPQMPQRPMAPRGMRR